MWQVRLGHLLEEPTQEHLRQNQRHGRTKRATDEESSGRDTFSH